MPIHERKRMPKSNHYILKYGDWKFGRGNASVRTLHQPPIRIFSPQGKTYVNKYVRADTTSVCTVGGKNKNKKILFCVRADETNVYADALIYPRGHNQRPHGQEKK
jgi:hypothetical protein